MNNAQIEISNWLNSERNYSDGVFLYDRYGKNPVLKRLFPGRENCHARKLAYELGKLIGIGFAEFNSGEMIIPEKEEPETNNPVTRVRVHPLHDVAKGIFYPSVIDRIKAEMSSLYNERAMLKTQQNNVPDENTDENTLKRKALIEVIEAISIRLDVLFQAKKAFLETGTLPEEKELFGKPESDIASPEKLEKRRKNLRSYISKARSMLDFQSEKKPKNGKVNPMPDCPKREQLVKQITAWENEITEIEKKEKDVDQSEPTPETGQDEQEQ